jgi:hypothetical protein
MFLNFVLYEVVFYNNVKILPNFRYIDEGTCVINEQNLKSEIHPSEPRNLSAFSFFSNLFIITEKS